MKITSVEIYWGAYINVKINTDEGISGWGECGLSYGASKAAGFGQCQDYAKMIIGMDPMNTEEIWNLLYRHTFWAMGGGAVTTAGISAIDTACWDIKGKALNVPVYQLLGGKTNKKLRTYASQLQGGWRKSVEAHPTEAHCLFDPEEYADAVKDAMSEGYTAVKIDATQIPADRARMGEIGNLGISNFGHIERKDLDRYVARIAAAREAGGKDLDILIETHSLLDTNTILEYAKELEPYNVMYLEEPTMPANPALFKYISDHCRIPLATGERSYTRWAYLKFFEDRSLSLVQPDLANTGGITEIKKISDMAQCYDIGVQIHVCGGPIANAASLHVETAIPNFIIHEEHMGNLFPIYKMAGKYHYEPVNGYYTVPELPGLGQELTDEYLSTCTKAVVD